MPEQKQTSTCCRLIYQCRLNLFLIFDFRYSCQNARKITMHHMCDKFRQFSRLQLTEAEIPSKVWLTMSDNIYGVMHQNWSAFSEIHYVWFSTSKAILSMRARFPRMKYASCKLQFWKIFLANSWLPNIKTVLYRCKIWRFNRIIYDF